MSTGKEQKLLGYHQQAEEENQNNISAGMIDMNSSVGKLSEFLFSSYASGPIFMLTHICILNYFLIDYKKSPIKNSKKSAIGEYIYTIHSHYHKKY